MRDNHRSTRTGEATAKGYDQGDFFDAFSRYLPGNGKLIGNKVTTPANTGGSPIFSKETMGDRDLPENGVLPNKDADCYLVTDQNPEKEALLI